MLGNSFASSKRCSDTRAGLRDVVAFAGHRFGIDTAVVLVTPDDEIDLVAEAILRHARLGPMSDSALRVS